MTLVIADVGKLQPRPAQLNSRQLVAPVARSRDDPRMSDVGRTWGAEQYEYVRSSARSSSSDASPLSSTVASSSSSAWYSSSSGPTP